MITTKDDKKGKWQSWEATFADLHEPLSLDRRSVEELGLCGYGATEAEAIAALREQARALAADLLRRAAA